MERLKLEAVRHFFMLYGMHVTRDGENMYIYSQTPIVVVHVVSDGKLIEHISIEGRKVTVRNSEEW